MQTPLVDHPFTQFASAKLQGYRKAGAIAGP